MSDAIHSHFCQLWDYEYPQNEVLKGYFEESKGLFQASTDSISRFSAKVNEFTTRIPEAKNDPLYTKILSILSASDSWLPPSSNFYIDNKVACRAILPWFGKKDDGSGMNMIENDFV